MQAPHWRAAVISVLALAGSCASGRSADIGRDVGDAVASPLRDVGIVRRDIPTLLLTLQYPYSTASLASGCSAVAYELGQLDAILGPESLDPGPARNIWDRSGGFAEQQTIKAAEDSTEDRIPFRSWVRRISGASAAERDALRAFANGQQRRTFLRGYGSSLGCPSVVPAPEPARNGAPRN